MYGADARNGRGARSLSGGGEVLDSYAPTRCFQPAPSRRTLGETAMAWTTPVVIETACGAEINLYISAEI
jgi:coenzyme PQQ precursor peptide PqqA